MFYGNKIFRKPFCELLFGNYISRKSGKQCCRFGQNGKPLNQSTVEKFLNTLNTTTDGSLNWKADEDYTKLYRLFVFKNVFMLTDFIRDIYDVDFKIDTQQIPSILVKNQEIFRIELSTPALKGLSFKDLQLATAINSMNFNKYGLIAIQDETNYKRTVRNELLKEQNKIKETYGDGTVTERTKLKNKYNALEYNQSLIEENFAKRYLEENKCGGGNCEGCACNN